MGENQLTVVRSTSGPTREVIGVAGVDTPGAVTVVTLPWWQMLMVRVLRVYIQGFLGLLGADSVGMIELAKAGTAWQHIAAVAYVATAPAFISLLWNASEFLTNLDQTRPGIRA